MRIRHQEGYLRLASRRSGPSCWEFLWWETESTGRSIRRKTTIGTILQFPDIEDAWHASNGLRTIINEERKRCRLQPVTVRDLVDHYIQTELNRKEKSHATRIIYKEFLNRWIKPHWGSFNLYEIRTVAVERWLGGLRRVDAQPLAPSTRAKIRNLMSVLFNHAIRYEWLEQGRNPITLVRQSAIRQKEPDFLEPEEYTALLRHLPPQVRVMVFLDAATGLRRSELVGLQWKDIDFGNLEIRIQRSIYLGVVGRCKTAASRKPIPMDPALAYELWAWKQQSKYSDPDDWVFASPRTKGRKPYTPDIILTKIIRPAAGRAGIGKHIGWHTFRHSFSTLLLANGEKVKVVQELMRHANCRFTLDIYSQARVEAKRAAQRRIIEMISPEHEIVVVCVGNHP